MSFREMITDRETMIFGGKNSKNNEELIAQVEKNEEVFHTAEPGSPFVNIKGKARRGDVRDAVVFCAAYSKDWKKNKKDVIVHRFKGKNVYKDSDMKTGTFGVKKFKKIKVKKKEIEDFLKKWGE